jgi:hypothetical protein
VEKRKCRGRTARTATISIIAKVAPDPLLKPSVRDYWKNQISANDGPRLSYSDRAPSTRAGAVQ